MRYVDVNTGDAFVGKTFARVVLRMKDEAWMAGKGKGAYMREVAFRVEQLTPGAAIKTETPRAFLASLVEAGYLRRERIT